MDEGRRRSQREIKARREEGFIYYGAGINHSLSREIPRSDVWQHRTTTSAGHLNVEADNHCSDEADASTIGEVISSLSYAVRSWSDTDIYSENNVHNVSNTQSTSIEQTLAIGSRSHSHFCRLDRLTFVDNRSAGSSVEGGSRGADHRRFSSTDGHFLDLSGNFLSLDSSVNLTAMSDTETGADSAPNSKTGPAKASKGEHSRGSGTRGINDNMLGEVMFDMLEKLEELSNQVTTLQNRITTIEGGSDVNSGNEQSRQGSSSGSKPQQQKQKKNAADKGKGKKERVLDEKERSYKVLMDKWESFNKGKGKDKSESERDASDEDSSSPDSSSSSSSSASSAKSKKKKRSRRKKQVKSGAKVKQRPVKQTELWPHTVANEEDGEEVTCDNISLAKFLSCFTFIMVSCKGIELEGRTALLHAVSLVLECLPWADARIFHNLVMLKVEQRRIDWTADFPALAQLHLDKKVRKSMRPKVPSSSTSTSYRPNPGSRNYNRGYGSYPNNGGSNRSGSAPVYTTVCRNWNNGMCSYGIRCKRWHCCWSCYEQGRPGEQQKATTHEGSNPRGNQQV